VGQLGEACPSKNQTTFIDLELSLLRLSTVRYIVPYTSRAGFQVHVPATVAFTPMSLELFNVVPTFSASDTATRT